MNLDRYVGLPWVLGGCEFAGVDCWGLVTLYFREELGIVLPQSGRGNAFTQIEHYRACDVGMFVGHGGWHCGVVSPWGLLHVREGQTSKISPMSTFRHMKTAQFFRWPG